MARYIPENFDEDAYDILATDGKGHPAFDRHLATANAATLCQAVSFHWESFGSTHLQIDPILEALERRFGFTDDDIQAFAEGREPEGDAARASLGLPLFTPPTGGTAAGDAPAVSTPASGLSPQASALSATPSPMSETNSTSYLLRDPNSLALHPCLEGMPELATDDPKFQGWLADIRDRGFDYPVIIDEQDRIIDGRHRRRIAGMLGIQVPTTRRAGTEAVEIVLAALMHRRHYSKGALAYMASPLFAQVVEASRARRLAALVPGAAHRKPTESVIEGNPRNPTQSVIGKTVEQLAEELGFSLDLYTQAKKVRELFADDTEHEWNDLPRPTTYRRYFEGKLLAGEIGLGGIIQAVAGKVATQGQTKITPKVATLFERGLQQFTSRFALKWEKLSPDDRRPIVKTIATEVTKWPEDVRQAAMNALVAAAKHKPSDTGF